MKKTILLIRHAEARKNIDDIHGGSGTGLTENGLLQSQAVGLYVKKRYCPKNGILVTHQLPQVLQTASIVNEFLGLPIVFDERLKGIDLGAMAGLSRNEARQKYPIYAEKLELWRNGKISPEEVILPQGENFDSFKFRVDEAWKSWLKKEGKILVSILTNSTLIMIYNLVLMSEKFEYRNYAVYPFDNASITVLEFSKSSIRVDVHNFSEHLSNLKPGVD